MTLQPQQTLQSDQNTYLTDSHQELIMRGEFKFHLKPISKRRYIFFLTSVAFQIHSLNDSSSPMEILIWNVNDFKKKTPIFAIIYPWPNSKVD